MDHCSSIAVHGSTIERFCTAFSLKNFFRSMDQPKLPRKSSLPTRVLKGTTNGVSRMFSRKYSEAVPRKIEEEIDLTVESTQVSINELHPENEAADEEKNIYHVLSLPEPEMRSKIKKFNDEAIFDLLQNGLIPLTKLENIFVSRQERPRAIRIRRMWLSHLRNFCVETLFHLPYKFADYSLVKGVARKVCLGYVPLPLGIAGPFLMMEFCGYRGRDAAAVHVPMATTEGCLVASVQRGARALQGGIRSQVYADFATSSPLIEMSSSIRALQVINWLEQRRHVKLIRRTFESVDPVLKFGRMSCKPAGKLLYLRFHVSTGDSVDIKMIAIATNIVLKVMKKVFPDLNIVSPVGNFGSDGRKPSALNWVEGRGKSVIAEAVLPEECVKKVLKTRAIDLEYLNRAKNIIGSGLSGSIGGANAHAANIVTAIFLATGQDISNIVGSSSCITQMEAVGSTRGDLHISVTMPSLDVATQGGMTNLPQHASCLKIMGVQGNHPTKPGENSRMFARLICSAVMAGELSLMAALCANHLVSSHLKLNRSSVSLPGLCGGPAESDSSSGDEQPRGPPKSI